MTRSPAAQALALELGVSSVAGYLFQERVLKSVTANTRRDGEELPALADALDLRVITSPYGFDGAQDALCDLAEDRVKGAAVLVL